MACLRLKRLLEEDPVEAILVSHKRRCLDKSDVPGEGEEVETVFKFVGTVRSKDESIENHLSKAIGRENGTMINRKRTNDCTVDEAKKCKVESRLPNLFKVVRTGSEDETALAAIENTVKGLCKLYDAEQCSDVVSKTEIKEKESDVITCNGTPLQIEDASADKAEYVYDLYYSDALDCTNDELLENSIKIEYCALGVELQYDNEKEDATDENDEDSNDEMNWKNDYPDEDEFENDYAEDSGEEEESIREKMAAFGIGNGSFYEDSSGDEVDSEDEHRFGRSYAKVRARILAQREDGDVERSSILTKPRSGNPFAG